MRKIQFIYLLLVLVFMSSCTQWKNLTARDNSTTKNSTKTAKSKDIRFLDNIAVTPGRVVTTKGEPVTSMPSLDKRIKERDAYNNRMRKGRIDADIERADWLQLKYAIALDATVESLTNINLLKIIDEWWGTNYCIGGSTRNCIDCSGFSNMLMQNVYNVSLPRTAQEQYNLSNHINLEEMREGDLVFFYTGGREISHVGVYLLNNKFVHASSSGGVMVNDLNDSYWKSRFKGAGRYNK